MPEKFFLSESDAVGIEALHSTLHSASERVLWSGHCAVAEYAFEQPASLPRWTLPEETEVVVTDQRVIYRDPATMGTGELQWPWPQHLRVQPGNRETGRNATVTQIQLVCGGPGETFPALVFAGGDLTAIGDSDRLANVLRQAIARYRVEYADDLGLAAPQVRMLSRLVIGPEFSNHLGGTGQTVSLLGALPVQSSPAPAEASPAWAEAAWDDSSVTASASAPVPARADQTPGQETTAIAWPGSRPEDARQYAEAGWSADSQPYGAEWDSPQYSSSTTYQTDAGRVDAGWADSGVAGSGWADSDWADSGPADSGRADSGPADSGRAVAAVVRPAAPQHHAADVDWPQPAEAIRRSTADEVARRTDPAPVDLASRAADLAARVAMLVSGGGLDQHDAQTTNLSAYLGPEQTDEPSAPLGYDGESRAEAVRRTGARLAGNAARGRSTPPQRHTEDTVGIPPRTGHRR